MTRPKFRRNLRLENLESRQLLASGGPSAQQQYMLELLNLARTNPASIAERVTTKLDADVQATVKYYNVNLNEVRSSIASLPAQPPLAWNTELADAAQGHSQDQANTGVQSHSGSDGSDLNSRLDRVGYTNKKSAGENAFAYSKSVDEAMEAFLIDWGVADKGHRANILQPGTSQEDSYREVGIGIVNTKKPSPVGPVVVTQNFGSLANDKADLLGVAYDDQNHDNFYSQGEGRGDVTIEAVNEANGSKVSVQTWDSGGYQIPLDPGQYKVTARVGDQVVRDQVVSINNTNVKVDYDLSQPWQGASTPSSTPPVSAPATPPPSDAPKLMMQQIESPPVATPPAEAPPVVVPVTEAPKQDETPTVTVAVTEPTTIQANTVAEEHAAVAPPSTPDSSFSLNWMSWKAKKS